MSDNYEIPHRVVPKVGEKIGQYKILQKLGEGSFGSVFKVSDDNRSVYALKLLNLYAIPGEEQRMKIMQRFKLEYETGLIQSKYLVRARDTGKKEGNPYIIMDFCPNGDLRSKVNETVSIGFINNIANNILLGLKALHKEGKVHRDLKPENVLLDEQHIACLTDFGISGHKDMRMTKVRFGKPQEIFGTYAYMPPEQMKPGNKNVTILPTTDIYSFGVTMFEIFTAKLPFGPLQYETDIGEYILRLNKGKWDNIQALRQDIPDYWVEIIEKCLQANYKNRYQNVDQVLSKLGKPDQEISQKYDPYTDNLGLKIMQGEEYGKLYNMSEMLNGDDGLLKIGWKGNAVNNEIAIKEEMTAYISRGHATVEKVAQPAGWFIRDGQFQREERQWKFSTNGTYVNSKEITMESYPIMPDDIIAIGDTTLKVVIL